jgi:hypothetical protein
MRLYPGHQSSGNNFMTYINNQLLRAEQLSENAFGTLAQKFRIFKELLSHLLKMLTTLFPQHVYCTFHKTTK